MLLNVLLYESDLFQNLIHHSLHIRQIRTDHPRRHDRAAALVTEFRQRVQRLYLLIIIVADTDNLRLQKGQLFGNICFRAVEIPPLDSFDQKGLPDILGTVPVSFQNHLCIEFLELIVRKPDIDIVFSNLTHSSISSNTLWAQPKASDYGASNARRRRTRWDRAPGLAFVTRTPISQFAPKVKRFHPFGLRCKDSK